MKEVWNIPGSCSISHLRPCQFESHQNSIHRPRRQPVSRRNGHWVWVWFRIDLNDTSRDLLYTIHISLLFSFFVFVSLFNSPEELETLSRSGMSSTSRFPCRQMQQQISYIWHDVTIHAKEDVELAMITRMMTEKEDILSTAPISVHFLLIMCNGIEANSNEVDQYLCNHLTNQGLQQTSDDCCVCKTNALQWNPFLCDKILW